MTNGLILLSALKIAALKRHFNAEIIICEKSINKVSIKPNLNDLYVFISFADFLIKCKNARKSDIRIYIEQRLEVHTEAPMMQPQVCKQSFDF